MSSLPSLLKRAEAITRQIVELEGERTRIYEEVNTIATGPRKRKPSASIESQTVSEGLKAVVKVLRDAGKPLQRQEVAAALKINGSNAGWRLKQALKMGFVENLGRGRYASAPDVPAF